MALATELKHAVQDCLYLAAALGPTPRWSPRIGSFRDRAFPFDSRRSAPNIGCEGELSDGDADHASKNPTRHPPALRQGRDALWGYAASHDDAG